MPVRLLNAVTTIIPLGLTGAYLEKDCPFCFVRRFQAI
jgi:hypothetical protein